MLNPALLSRSRSVIQGNFQQHELNSDHDNSLRQQCDGIVVAKPVEDPAMLALAGRLDRAAHFRIEAISIIKGISSEKPAELLLRCILRIWSVYEVKGDVTRLFRDDVSTLCDRVIYRGNHAQYWGPIFEELGHNIHRVEVRQVVNEEYARFDWS
jgi:hypothetical protein